MTALAKKKTGMFSFISGRISHNPFHGLRTLSVVNDKTLVRYEFLEFLLRLLGCKKEEEAEAAVKGPGTSLHVFLYLGSPVVPFSHFFWGWFR